MKIEEVVKILYNYYINYSWFSSIGIDNNIIVYLKSKDKSAYKIIPNKYDNFKIKIKILNSNICQN